MNDIEPSGDTNIDAYLRYLRDNRHVQRKRITDSRRILMNLRQFIGGPVEQIDTATWRRYAALRAPQVAPSMLGKELKIVRAYLNWTIGEGNPTGALAMAQLRNEMPPGIPDEPRPYDRREINLLWDEIHRLYPEAGKISMRTFAQKRSNWKTVWRHFRGKQLTAQVLLALHGGLRPGEIMRVTLDDVAPENEYLVVRGAAKGAHANGGVRPRSVPFTDPMRYALADWLEARALMRPDHDQLWLWVRNRLSTSWNRAAAHPASPLPRDGFAASLKPPLMVHEWEWYRLRHTAATEWLRAGMDLELVSKLLGHAELGRTLRYAKILPDDVRRAAVKSHDTFIAATTPPNYGKEAA